MKLRSRSELRASRTTRSMVCLKIFLSGWNCVIRCDGNFPWWNCGARALRRNPRCNISQSRTRTPRKPQKLTAGRNRLTRLNEGSFCGLPGDRRESRPINLYFFGLCFAAAACCFFWFAALFLSCFCLFCFWTDFGDRSPIILILLESRILSGRHHPVNSGKGVNNIRQIFFRAPSTHSCRSGYSVMNLLHSVSSIVV